MALALVCMLHAVRHALYGSASARSTVSAEALLANQKLNCVVQNTPWPSA